ncbi:uncharacterized protein LOC130667708 isoform X1 [Microplitis mediator]|uniref:uncharacterized protein LOC130667708 isoform X1 n=1 Tax=Microplitis mediator TaxID=375433 RepID=UPI002557A3CA|nr:uncharacterized protein LOC130667708 isoform X1 [Microplitis mediator]
MVLLNYYILPIISLVAIYLTFCESATIKTEIESSNESQFKFFMANQRSSLESRSCGLDMPCGWLEYRLNSFGQKTLKSFLLGRCKCDVGNRCVLSGERLSSQVFVYQCRPNITNNDKFAPDHDIYKPNEDLYKLYRDIIR